MPLATDGELKCGQCSTLLSKVEDGQVVRACWRCGNTNLIPGPLAALKQQQQVRDDAFCDDCGAQFPPPHSSGCVRGKTSTIRIGETLTNAMMARNGYACRWRHIKCHAIFVYTRSGWSWPSDTLFPDGSAPRGFGHPCVCGNCGIRIDVMGDMQREDNQ
jgi:DNA-directed RNA polymerase subunit RPC12/RpoP